MAGSLAASLVAAGRPANTAVQGDTVSVKFAHPPEEATDVKIEVFQKDPGRSVVEFLGEFKGSKYVSHLKSGNTKVSPNHDRPDDMTVVFEVNGAKFAAMMLDPKAFVTAHKLRVEVTGIVGGKKQTFKGKSLLHVFYKTAMIVPSGHAKDPALVVLPKWAQQWKAHESSVRTIVSLPSIPAVTGKITPASYNPLIAAVTKAAKAAPHGIVALAVGHGDAGNPNQTNPWCDLVAEDGKIDDETYDRGLFIDDLELKDGEPEPGPIKTTPGGRTMVKLDALDRMADVFAKHPIRALLLHTCSAGAAPKFIQRSCNRVRVFVRAHTQQIEYTGNTAGSIEASYAGEAAGPNAKHEWPVAHVTREFAPTTPPPERFPL